LQLDADVAAAALSALPEDLHTPVLHRVAKLGPVSRQAIDILEGTLNAKIEKLHGTIPLTMGGIKHAAEIINQSHRSVEKRVLPTIGKIDKKLAKELENEMFKFEHLFALDMKMTGVLLREVESDTKKTAASSSMARCHRARPMACATRSRCAAGSRRAMSKRRRRKSSRLPSA
jgi:flagellar motor switch protein FliG